MFISGFINQNRSTYYKLIREVTEKKNWKRWILFILDAVKEQSIKTTQSVIGIRELMQHYREVVSHKKPKIYSAELIEYLFSYPYYTQQTMLNTLNISSRNTASKYFAELKDIGLIKEEKYKKEKIYFCLEFHELLR